MNVSASYEIRTKLDHPVIDADGHTSEYLPALAEYLRDVGISTDFNELFRGVLGATADWYEHTPEERRRKHLTKSPWWTRPMRDARDRAAACFPRYLRERMDEFGCDVSVIYPSTGLAFLQLPDDEVRRGACRALNRYHRDAFDGCTDRLIPVAAVPAHTPQEAIEELDYAVLGLGYRAVVIPSYIPRPIPGYEDAAPDIKRFAFWVDTYGIDSEHDYDPFWRRCIELGISPGTHTQGNGIGFRRSTDNWVYNHIGHFAASGEALCKSLFLSGVTRRFPELRLALLEGGVGWACSLYSDLIGHWEKRNVRALRENLDPALLDVGAFEALAATWASVGIATTEKIVGATLTTPGHTSQGPSDDEIDEFAALGIDDAAEIPGLFLPNFYFGCEADDPMNALAFLPDRWPYGANLNAMYGSDIGHFDVPSLPDVLHEAWENVERGWMDLAQFRRFMFDNPARFYLESNPDFFAGTVLADQTARVVHS
ncbi:MAG TPA: amidohydrolase family protein [Acidimicrobiales bacterium]|nr:amidohydrolase family protein [Acidimicrobiales bacterium]